MKKLIIILLIALFAVTGCDYWDTNPFSSPLKEPVKQQTELVCKNGYCQVVYK